MGEARVRHLLELHAKHCRVIEILELNRAAMGPTWPTSQQLELEQATRDRDLVAAELELLSPSPEARAATSDEARWLLVEWRFQSLAKKVDDALAHFQKQITLYQDADAKERARSQLGLRLMLGLMLVMLVGILVLQFMRG